MKNRVCSKTRVWHIKLCRGKNDNYDENELKTQSQQEIMQLSLQIMNATLQGRIDTSNDRDIERAISIPWEMHGSPVLI
jgi:hypothetical protein